MSRIKKILGESEPTNEERGNQSPGVIDPSLRSPDVDLDSTFAALKKRANDYVATIQRKIERKSRLYGQYTSEDDLKEVITELGELCSQLDTASRV